MATHNDVTGDAIKSKLSTDRFRSGYDQIDWSKKSKDTALQNQHGSHAKELDTKNETK